MGSIKVQYLIKRSNSRYYWNPNKFYVVNGLVKKCPWSMMRLSDDSIEAAAQAKQYNADLLEWRGGDHKELVEKDSVGGLVGEYRKSSRFKELADSTQQLYLWTFPEIVKTFRRVPAAKVTRQMAQQLYEKLKGAGHTRKPSQVMQIAGVVFQYGEDMGVIVINPFTRQRITKAKPRRMIISPVDIAAAKTKALELGLKSVARAIQLGYDAGQRPGDIRTLHRHDYDGSWLRVVQKKTGAVVDVPVHKMPSLKAELDNMDHASTLILHEERTGKPYSKDMLCRRVREVFEAIGLGHDVQFRDLRRTSVVRLAEASCTIPEICAITGHNLKEATEILKVYMPLSRNMAENAADKVLKLQEK